jgi:hypothetical protein
VSAFDGQNTGNGLTADDSVIGHLLEVLANQNITATSGGDKDLSLASSLLHGQNLVARDSSLESVDGINLSDDDTSSHSVKSHSTPLSDITITSNDGDLTSNHNIGSTLNTVDQGLTAAVQVVELGLCDGIVDVDSWDEKTLALQHSVQVVDTGGGLLRDTIASFQHLWVLVVDESSEIPTVIENQVQALAILERNQLLFQTPLILLLSLSLPCENGNTC